MTMMITVLEGRLKRWSVLAFQQDDMKNSWALKRTKLPGYSHAAYPMRE